MTKESRQPLEAGQGKGTFLEVLLESIQKEHSPANALILIQKNPF